MPPDIVASLTSHAIFPLESASCSTLDVTIEDDQELTTATSDIDDTVVPEPPAQKRKDAQAKVIAVRPPNLSFPKSLYDDETSRKAAVHEIAVLEEFLREDGLRDVVRSDSESNTFISATLEDYSVYRRHKVTSREYSTKKRPRESPLANQLVSLNEINERSIDYLLFDGVICFDNQRRYVRRVPFELLSIGQYLEPETATAGQEMWIQSFEGSKHNVWYQLGKPSPEYEPFQHAFAWLADFAKHIIYYLHLHSAVNLEHFRRSFFDWLNAAYSHDISFNKWVQLYKRVDFRSAIAANANFLYCQAAQVDRRLTKQPLWRQIDSRDLVAVPEQIERKMAPKLLIQVSTGKETTTQRKTTVTPFVKGCFQNMPWAVFMHCDESAACNIGPKTAVAVAREQLRRPIEVGDVVAIDSEGESLWKTKDREYYAYVQDVAVNAHGRSLKLLWFYRPWDTACQNMQYPFANELFLSDHCNCGDSEVYERDVIRLPKVRFFGQPDSPDCDFFCRQQYIEAESEWRTLSSSNFRCQCRAPREQLKLVIGDTVLIKKRSKSGQFILEPAVIEEQILGEPNRHFKVRYLKSKRKDFGNINALPNEVVYTDHFGFILRSAIERHCQIRFFSEVRAQFGQIPHPYSMRGSGDFFFITHSLSEEIGSSSLLKPMAQPWPVSMKQGWLPEDTPGLRRLKGLDIFCGGGNFGRGLEEGGAVDFEWAVDYCNEAIHTYKANLPEQKEAKLFRGSVNDYLSQAMAGEGVGLVAQQGEVEVIISGNPCQGYSLLNPLRGIHDRGLLNESMVASAISFIDFYRPKYALLENVLGIASGSDGHNVLAQVLCALVGLGYQVRPCIMDAWNYGSPQRRSRVIIACTAAGLEPLKDPPHTHSHPGQVTGHSLGKAANGLKIGCRYRNPTPFEYITAEEALKDLPATNGRIYCVPYPDHRVSIPQSTTDAVRLESIPCQPAGMSFMKAIDRGYMAQAQTEDAPWQSSVRGRIGSRTWQRIVRDALMPTVTTVPRPQDGIAGDCLHWNQHRLLTIMEVRRAQGFPDDEVLIGEKPAQYKIVGNSVARHVAFALGMSLRKAWTASLDQASSRSIREPRADTNLMTPLNMVESSELKLGGEKSHTGDKAVESSAPRALKVVIPLSKSNSLKTPDSTIGSRTDGEAVLTSNLPDQQPQLTIRPQMIPETETHSPGSMSPPEPLGVRTSDRPSDTGNFTQKRANYDHFI